MILSAWSVLCAVLLVACLASFRWGMLKFFSQPAGLTTGMKVISVCGAVFAILHLAAILLAPAIPANRGATGGFLYVLALGLFWWAIRANSPRPLSAAFSPDSPQHLVERGPYRWMRHPFYCSYLLTWLAGVIASGMIWLIPTVVVMLAIYVRAARMEEEKFTHSPLASKYERYRAHTGLLLPNPIKLVTARRWS
jgi:protein-S-isoprenylcysteine O-methyltransferase Ste14